MAANPTKNTVIRRYLTENPALRLDAVITVRIDTLWVKLLLDFPLIILKLCIFVLHLLHVNVQEVLGLSSLYFLSIVST